MRIPSYDDLTPSIPDVSPGDVFASVDRVLPAGGPVASRTVSSWHSGARALFACVRSRRSPEAAIAIARDFSPRLERHGPDSVVLDVSGLGRLLGDARAIGAELERAAAIPGGITVAVAPTQVASLLLSRARPALAVVTGDPAAAMEDIPLAILRQFLADVHGVAIGRKRPARGSPTASRPAGSWPPWPASEVTFDVLQRWGLTTLGEFAALPAADLSQRIGQDGLALQQLACGLDPRPLVPDPGVPRFIQAVDLEWPIEELEPLSFVLARLLDPLAMALERADRGAAAIRLDLRLVDRTTHARVLQLPAAMRDPRVLRTLLLLDLESHPPPAGIDVVSIEIDPAPARIVQYSLLERALPPAEAVATLMARLSALVGDTRCGSPALLDTHRPDAIDMRPFMPCSRRGRLPFLKREQPPFPQADAERTLEMVAVPVLRRFRPPVAVRVTVERRRPVHVAIDRRGMPGGAVEQCAGPWRTSGAWWDGGGHWDRDEWDVGLSDNSLCRLFRDRSSGVWFVEGIFD